MCRLPCYGPLLALCQVAAGCIPVQVSVKDVAFLYALVLINYKIGFRYI